MRILVLEDNALIALELEDILRRAGHEVVGPFANTDDAIRAVERDAIDGALIDFRIGTGDSRRLADVLGERGCPFAFVTGTDGILPNESPFTPVRRIAKPFAATDILDAVGCFRMAQRTVVR